jgi:Protein of unknown function (DUF4236)
VGFYVRKSVKAGPFRFNLSKSGLGVSAGVPGFRVGTGPRGNYVHMGRHGVYYRASLTGSRSQRSPQQPRQLPAQPHSPQYRPSGVVMEDVTGATAMSLVPTGSGDLIEQLNAAGTRFRWGWPAAIATFLLGLLSMPTGLVVWLVFAPLCWWLFLRDKANDTVVVFYDVNDAPAAWFDSLVTSWEWLSGSQKLWRVMESGVIRTIYDYKTNSGADHVDNIAAAAAGTSGPPHLSSNVAIPSLVAGKNSLYFLPDRLLVRDGKHYSDVSYQHLKTQGSQQNFVHSPSRPLPGDAVQVGQTWQYVNVKGGPDRRYSNNPLLPIMRYGYLDLSSPQGLYWRLQISRADAAPAVASVLSEASASGRAS